MSAAMGRCPHCGAELSARQVAEIKDPLAEESCPRRPKGQAKPRGRVIDMSDVVRAGQELRRVAFAELSAELGKPVKS